MRYHANTRWVLILAAGAVALGLGSAEAQYQTLDSTGRMLDANNRLGSDGVNDRRSVAGGVSGDDIVYGNVTRGREFRGNVNSKDARAFRGNIKRPSDLLTRDAGVSVYERGAGYDSTTAQEYFGDRRAVAPPTGFQNLQPGSPGAFRVTPPVYRVPGDLRMDATIANPEFGLSRPANYIMPGVNDLNPVATGALTPLVAPEARSFEGRDQSMGYSRELLLRLGLNEERVREMRDEYQRGDKPDSTTRDPNDVTLAPETPINDPLDSRLATADQTKAATGSLNTEQSLSQRLITAAPLASRQDTQYAELQKRLDRFRQRRNMTDEDANRLFMEDWTAAQKAEQAAKDAKAAENPKPALQTPDKPSVEPVTPKQDEDKFEPIDNRRGRALTVKDRAKATKVEGILPPQPDIPVRIASFADGVKATGLKSLLADAEKAMHDGKFTQSLDYYDAAAGVAPDNSMVLMGRAVAELGAGYYARAQTHLEQVLQADPSLLMARYDLKAFYGEDRLQYIVRDLKDLSQAETRQARPLFLLAFVAFSTENEQRTADYLKLAEERGGSKAFYDQLREYWRLTPKAEKPAAPSAPKIEVPAK